MEVCNQSCQKWFFDPRSFSNLSFTFASIVEIYYFVLDGYLHNNATIEVICDVNFTYILYLQQTTNYNEKPSR